MNKIRGYANYGVLGYEKKILFTIGDTPADCTVSERIEYTIPDDWDIGENECGAILLIAPWGQSYISNEVIISKNNKPYLSGYDENGRLFNVPLDWLGQHSYGNDAMLEDEILWIRTKYREKG